MIGNTRRRRHAPSQYVINELERRGATAFVYTGGEQVVPFNVSHVIIDPSVKVIPRGAFQGRSYLISVQMHDGVERIEEEAFQGCHSLRGINLRGVKFIGSKAFSSCSYLFAVEFGDNLEKIAACAFEGCRFLKSIKLKAVRIIEQWAFGGCECVTDFELHEVERIGMRALNGCPSLRHMTIPHNFFPKSNGSTLLSTCNDLTTIFLVGSIHEMIEALPMESWKAEMNQEIDRINRVLLDTRDYDRTDTVRDWLRSVNERMDHFKAKHRMLLKEGTTLLELALWKAKLDKKGDKSLEAKVGVESYRQEKRITSGADVVIKNVLPFLRLE